MTKVPMCPDCGALMKLFGRGATLQKHGKRWLCPVAADEVLKDVTGRLFRPVGSKHVVTRIWLDWQLPVIREEGNGNVDQ